MPTSDVTQQLVAYMDARRKQRDEEAAAKWEALSPREQHLVKEAVVMGWVQGAMAREVQQSDMSMVRTVLQQVESFPDLYPTLCALGDE